MMSDYIKRDDAIENIDELYFSDKDDHDRTREAIKRLSAADAVEVVRCKDCKHRHDSLLNGSPLEDFCDVFPAYIGKDDYCSYGERADT